MDNLLVTALACGAYLGLLAGTRWWTRRRLQRLMYGGAPGTPATGAGAAPAPQAPPPQEVPAAAGLRIEVINAAWSSDDGDTHAQRAGQARTLLRLSTALDGAVAVAWVVMLAEPGAGNAWWLTPVLLWLLLALVRYPLYRRQYWVDGGDPSRSGLLARLASLHILARWSLSAVHKLASPALQPGLRWAALALLGWQALQHGLASGWWAVLLVLAVAGADAAWWRMCRRQRGDALLLLRVFHKTAQASDSVVATFGGVLQAWSHFGAYFTVMDEALMGFRSPVLHPRNLVVLFGLVVSTGGFSETISTDDAVTAGVLLLGGWALDAWLLQRSVLARVVADGRAVGGIARATQPARGLDMRYPSLELTCTHGTWYDTVVAVAGEARVVLMDLRGYAPDRTGCDVEVNLLFDAVPLRRIVFLIEPGTLGTISALFAQCWRALSVASPNLALPEPTVAVMEYPLQAERATDLAREKQILLEELLFRTTGRTQGRLERAKRTRLHLVEPPAPPSSPAPGAPGPDGPVLAAGVAAAAPVPRRPPRLSAEAQSAVRAAIAGFAQDRDLLQGADLTERKLHNARKHGAIPAEEEVLALNDLSMFGSAADFWAFTDQALRYRNFDDQFVVEYKYFPQRKFTSSGLRNIMVTAPDGMSITLNTSQGRLARSRILQLLQAITQAVAAAPATPFPAFGMATVAAWPPVVAPAVLAALQQAGAPTQYARFGADITPEMAADARTACSIPPEEDLLAVVPLTFFGSAKRCWAFTDLALRCRGIGARQALAYQHFPARRFGLLRGDIAADAPDGTAAMLPTSGGGASAAQLLVLLEAVQAALRAATAAQVAPAPRAAGASGH